MMKTATASDPPNSEITRTRTSHSLAITLVQDLVQRQLSEGTESSWTRPLMFRGCLVRSGEMPSSPLFTEQNLVEYATNSCYKDCRVYFDLEKYTPKLGSSKICAKDPAWRLLCTDLMRAGQADGMVLVSNGQEAHGCRRLMCTHGIFCDKRTISKHKENTDANNAGYRTTTLNADYKNVRRGGRRLPRRTSTDKPIMEEGQATCKWRLVFTCDANGFYMRCGVGCGQHSGHAPPLDDALQTTRKRLLDQPDKETLTHLAKSHANAGVGRNYMFSKTGVYMSLSQVRYIYSEPWQLPKATDGARPLDDVALDISTPPCQLLENFRTRNDISYSCLFSDAATIELPRMANDQPKGEILSLTHIP
jgi:hypothetical protein